MMHRGPGAIALVSLWSLTACGGFELGRADDKGIC